MHGDASASANAVIVGKLNYEPVPARRKRAVICMKPTAWAGGILFSKFRCCFAFAVGAVTFYGLNYQAGLMSLVPAWYSLMEMVGPLAAYVMRGTSSVG